MKSDIKLKMFFRNVFQYIGEKTLETKQKAYEQSTAHSKIKIIYNFIGAVDIPQESQREKGKA